MQKEQIIKLQNALNVLLKQIENHQQSKSPVLEVNRLIQQAENEGEFNFRVKVLETLENLSAAICDPFGLGKLNLMLKNARVPSKYYDIFYEMLAPESQRGGGDLKPLCIDCGAHAGLISDLMLHCGARVMSFEPNIYLNFFLDKKYAGNPNITLFNKAVGTKNDTTYFLEFQGRILSQGNRITSSIQDKETNKSYAVEVIDLCEFIEDILTSRKEIYFLKLDVEGVEFEIMEKLLEKELYKHIKYIACETHEYMFENGEYKLEKIKKIIEKNKINNIFLDWC